MCDAITTEENEIKACVRQFPPQHAEHASEDGVMWTD